MNLPYCETLQVARKKSSELNLQMKIIQVEKVESGGLIFYFESDNRVDFRELVRELNTLFNETIRLEQIGSRDVPQKIGGIGVCGKEVCCRQFLTEFKSITNDMISAQNLSSSPSQCTGICGKLMCCLAYECPKEKLAKVKEVKGKVKLAQKRPGDTNCINLNETITENSEQEKEDPVETPIHKKEKKIKKHKKVKQKNNKKKLKKVIRIVS